MVILGIFLYILLGLVTLVGFNYFGKMRFYDDESGMAIFIMCVWWAALIAFAVVYAGEGVRWIANNGADAIEKALKPKTESRNG